jgi:cobalt-zinc-cadmium efflux system protein
MAEPARRHPDAHFHPTGQSADPAHRVSGHHHAAPEKYDRAFAVGIGLNVVFVAVEACYGFWARSLALLADAGHNLSDVLGLVLAWGAVWLARRPPSRRRTYGLGRGTILAALINASTLLIAVGAIAVEAVRRLAHPEPVAGGTVMGVAALGIAVNAVTAAVVRKNVVRSGLTTQEHGDTLSCHRRTSSQWNRAHNVGDGLPAPFHFPADAGQLAGLRRPLPGKGD